MIRRSIFTLFASLMLGLLLFGCASVQTEAPIDEATAAQQAPARTSTDAAATKPSGTTTSSTAASTAGRVEPTVGTTAPVTPVVVETRPLPSTAMPTSAASSAAATAPAGITDFTTPGAHKDPASPLAQRVIYFEFDSAVIDSRFQPILDAHATYLKANPGFKVILQGHADERGSREYNLALGQRRAESVRQALSLLGVPDGQMEAVSFGEEKPAVQGSNEEAWRLNRRTEIHYVDE